jgi:release factor glutamine methyltransferase
VFVRIFMGTYKELLQTAREMLKLRGIADADLDAWYLLAHVFRIKRTDFLLRGAEAAPEEGSRAYIGLVEERAKHIPLQHLTGTQEFMGLEFLVNKDVLIPRQDTELLVEEVLKVCDSKAVLDMCTGSGCIIISLARLGRLKKAVGADISDKALSVAEENAAKLGAKIEFIQSDLFERIEESYDIIVANPPYISADEIVTLMPEVKDHEPALALNAGADGLEFYRRISSSSERYLKEGGYIFLEIGYNQGEAVKQILIREGFTGIIIKQDLSGRDRVVSAKRP